MKKKIAVLLFTAMSVGVISACGTDKGTTEETQTQTIESSAEAETESGTEAVQGESTPNVLIRDYNVEDYVTLNEYQNMEVTVSKPVVDDDTVERYITSRLSTYGGKKEFAVMDRAVKDGDTVNINYVGTLDGVAFEGGTDDSEAGTNLGIGSHSFIDGFEEGLIGAMPGDTVELNLTFPEGYQNADLAGKATVFTVTVNGIAPTAAELTDAMAASLDEENPTADGYRQAVKDMLTEEAQTEFDSSYDSYVEDALIQKLVEECIYKELPEELIAKYQSNFLNNMAQTAAGYSMDLESYISAAYRMEYAEFETLTRTWAESSAKQAMAFQAIANKENLNVDDATLETELNTYAQSYGYESSADLPADISEDYREYLMFMSVLDYLKEGAQVTVE